jgi:putative molybdopterin biosynthesis protein
MMVNREEGAGSRALLDAWLTVAGMQASQVRGYDRELPSHMAVAAAVSWGSADAAPGILAAARAFNLDFIPVQYERFDLAILSEYLDTPPVQALLEMAISPSYRAEVEALGGYDNSRTGAIVAEFK